ncbi:MAG: hypothetical protein PHU23_14995 [Dehalococcoidales bacterium]|nr:hypothetical protein [Dehalococcoidales bacterium]
MPKTKQYETIVALKPGPPFSPIFQVAVTREGSGIHIIQNKSFFCILGLSKNTEKLDMKNYSSSSGI